MLGDYGNMAASCLARCTKEHAVVFQKINVIVAQLYRGPFFVSF